MRVSAQGVARGSCASLDLLTGLTWLCTPALVIEWLYPELNGRGGLVWVEQGGWLLISRGAWVALSTSSSWMSLWWAPVPLHLWALGALSHLGGGAALWHGAQLGVAGLIALLARRPD